MLTISAYDFPDGHHVTADIAIVGAGAAGITLGMELRNSGLKVVIFEAGSYGLSDDMQELYRGELRGFPTMGLDESRLRMFGGTTNHWSGLCLELDDLDFEPREGIPHTGWPIPKSELHPYYERAFHYVQINPNGTHDVDRLLPMATGPKLDFDAAKFRHVVMNESPPTLFGNTYEADLEASENIQVVLDANLQEFEVNDAASEVTGLRFACFGDGPRFTASARTYILAAGGIENPRLLLLSNSVQSEGLGNGNDLVGRYFMDHNTIRPAVMTLVPDGAPDMSFYTQSHYDGTYAATIMLAGSQDLIRREQLSNFRAHIYESQRFTPGHQAASALQTAIETGKMPDDLGLTLYKAFTNLDGIGDELLRKVTGAETGFLNHRWLEVWVGFEHLPNPDSRIMLNDEIDAFGQRKVTCDWRLGETELRTVHRATQLVVEEFGRLGLGRSWSDVLWDPETFGNTIPGKHHVGTTRMSDDPATGIVNTDLRMHTVSNLYVAGSSIFPTEGQAAPTMSIVAFAIRLADKLKADMPRL